MDPVHPITRALRHQVRNGHITNTDGWFSPDFGYSISSFRTEGFGKPLGKAKMEVVEDVPHLTIEAKTRYRTERSRRDSISSSAELIQLWDDKEFLPSKRAIRTLAGILGTGEARVEMPYGEAAGFAYHEMRNQEAFVRMERENARPRPYPNLIQSSHDAYLFSTHYQGGELEEKLPWFRFGELHYATEDATLVFEIAEPSSTQGIVRVTFDLKELEKVDLGMVNATAWYMHRLSEK